MIKKKEKKFDEKLSNINYRDRFPVYALIKAEADEKRDSIWLDQCIAINKLVLRNQVWAERKAIELVNHISNIK